MSSFCCSGQFVKAEVDAWNVFWLPVGQLCLLQYFECLLFRCDVFHYFCHPCKYVICQHVYVTVL